MYCPPRTKGVWYGMKITFVMRFHVGKMFHVEIDDRCVSRIVLWISHLDNSNGYMVFGTCFLIPKYFHRIITLHYSSLSVFPARYSI